MLHNWQWFTLFALMIIPVCTSIEIGIRAQEFKLPLFLITVSAGLLAATAWLLNGQIAGIFVLGTVIVGIIISFILVTFRSMIP